MGDQGSQSDSQGTALADVDSQGAVSLAAIAVSPVPAHIQVTGGDPSLLSIALRFAEVRALSSLVPQAVAAAAADSPVGE